MSIDFEELTNEPLLKLITETENDPAYNKNDLPDNVLDSLLDFRLDAELKVSIIITIQVLLHMLL